MASLSTTNELPRKSLFGSLWRMWQNKRRRDRARALSMVRFRLTREGVHYVGILLFIFVGAMLRDINLLILLAGAMIGLLLLQWRFNTRTLIGLVANRSLPRTTFVGAATDVGVRVSNPKTWLGSWLITVEDPLSRVMPAPQRLAVKGQTVVDEIRPVSSSAARYQLTFHQRGKYAVGPSTISTRFPLGLGRGARTLDNTGHITVYPRLGRLQPRLEGLFQQEKHGHAQVSRKVGMHEAEFYGLRPWATGDSKRWIHWRTTARLGELSVRQFERQQRRQACVLLDLYRGDARAAEPDRHVELAVSFVATLASLTARYGSDRLAVAVAASESFALPSVQSSVLVENLLERLAVAAASPKPDLSSALQGISIPLLNNPHLIAISTRSDQSEAIRKQLADRGSRKLFARLHITWLDVSRGDLEPYFTWI